MNQTAQIEALREHAKITTEAMQLTSDNVERLAQEVASLREDMTKTHTALVNLTISVGMLMAKVAYMDGHHELGNQIFEQCEAAEEDPAGLVNTILSLAPKQVTH